MTGDSTGTRQRHALSSGALEIGAGALLTPQGVGREMSGSLALKKWPAKLVTVQRL